MSYEDAPPLQTSALLTALAEHDVDYVLVGGLAAVAHGASTVTRDLDLTPRWTDDNLDALAAALTDLGAALRLETGETLQVDLDAAYLEQLARVSNEQVGHEVSTWRTNAGDVDIIVGTPTRTPGELRDYDALATEAKRRTPFGVVVLVAGLDDLIEAKVAMGRPESDLAALPELHRLRDRQQRDGT